MLGASGGTDWYPSACAQNRASSFGSIASTVSCQNTMHTGYVAAPARLRRSVRAIPDHWLLAVTIAALSLATRMTLAFPKMVPKRRRPSSSRVIPAPSVLNVESPST